MSQTNRPPDKPGYYVLDTYYDHMWRRRDLVHVYYSNCKLVCESTIFNVKPVYEGYFGFKRENPDDPVQPITIFKESRRYEWTELQPKPNEEDGEDTGG